MIYKFIDDNGTFTVKNPHKYNLYFPLTNSDGSLLSSIGPNLGGDIKKDNEHFLTPPASIEDVRNNLLCRRDFFIKTDKEIIRLSSPSDDTLEAGFLYHKLIKETKSLRIEILSFIPHNIAAEVMWVRVINKTNKEIKITPTSFIPLYGRTEKNLRDHRHVSGLLNRIELDKYGIFLKPTMVFDEKGHKENKTVYYCLGYEGKAKPPAGQFPALESFYGESDLISPDAIYKNSAPQNKKTAGLDGKEACAAFRFAKKSLKKSGFADYLLIMGVEEDKSKIKENFRELGSIFKVEQAFSETKKYWQNYFSLPKIDFKNRDFNGWLLWVKLQPALRKLFGCSFLPHFDYGKGGRGWRDLWQDALTLLITEADKAKGLILHNFNGVRIDGSNATIISKNGDFISDRNNISRVWMDHAVWPYLTLKFYIHQAADSGMLLQECGYFRDHLLKRAKEVDKNFSQDDYSLRDKNGQIYRGSILEHLLVENLTAFLNVGEHNIIRLENGDWNDGLDMAPKRGESVTFSFMYAANLRDICDMLEKLKEKKESASLFKELGLLLERIDYSEPTAKQKKLDEYLESVKNISGEKVEVKIDSLIASLKEKSEHLSAWLREKEWLKEGFFNGYYDNKGCRAEGNVSGKIRMRLEPQVFSIMSAVAGEQQVKDIWVSIKQRLQDKKFGGFHLNTDLGSVYLDLGRAFGFAYGNKENGAIFNHMAVMLANALYKRGFTSEGFEALNSIYKMATAKEGGLYPGLPEYFNLQGKGLYLYLTGSASWYIYTLMQEVLGIKFIFGDLLLIPHLTDKNFVKGTIEIDFSLSEKQIKVIYIKEGKNKGALRVKEMFLDGVRVLPVDNGYIIRESSLKKENTIKVHLL